jgi:ABC-type bacteriocin/lantibiotic exporter with double-glycine peptidase domain
MVLEFHGCPRSESEVSDLLETTPLGTRSANVQALHQWGVRADRGPLAFAQVEGFIDEGLPVVALVWTRDLPHWQSDDPHAVVVVGLTADSVYVNDPAQDQAPLACSRETFLAAWARTANLAIVIAPLPSPERSRQS